MGFRGRKVLEEQVRYSLLSIDKEGTGKGFDTELISKISNKVSIPVIAHGGASEYGDHIKDAIFHTVKQMLSQLHQCCIMELLPLLNLNRVNSEGNIEFLKSNSNYKNLRQSR